MAITKEHAVELNGQTLVKGTKLSFKGVVGTFTFVSLDTNTAGTTWITCYGGRDGVAMWRSFRVDDLKEVHLSAA